MTALPTEPQPLPQKLKYPKHRNFLGYFEKCRFWAFWKLLIPSSCHSHQGHNWTQICFEIFTILNSNFQLNQFTAASNSVFSTCSASNWAQQSQSVFSWPLRQISQTCFETFFFPSKRRILFSVSCKTWMMGDHALESRLVDGVQSATWKYNQFRHLSCSVHEGNNICFSCECTIS